MERLNFDKNSLRKFGITMGTAFLLITLFIFIKHRYIAVSTSAIFLVFFVSALLIPGYLKPLYSLWMKFAFVLAWVNTRLILFILFYLVFTPTGLVMRVFGIDALDRKIDKSRNSYWKKKEKKQSSLSDYGRQF